MSIHNDNAAMARPYLDLLEASQSQWTDFQQSWWQSTRPTQEPPVEERKVDDWLEVFESFRSQCQEQIQNWMGVATSLSGEYTDATSDHGTPFEIYRHNLSATLKKMTDSPELSDIGNIERKILRQSREWHNLQEAIIACQKIVTAGCLRANEKMMAQVASDPALLKSGPRKLLNQWLELVNSELIATQRTNAFLKAQRKMLRASSDYRIHHIQLVEDWCEGHAIPSRSEVDELHKIVYELRRELRSLKRSGRFSDIQTKISRPKQNSVREKKATKPAAKRVSPKTKVAAKETKLRGNARVKQRVATADWAPIAAMASQ